MKETMFIRIISTILVILSTITFSDSSENTAVFLKMSPGARPSAMGSAFVGISDDANGIHWNPAGLAKIENSEFNATYVREIEGVGVIDIGYLRPLKKFKKPTVIGGGLKYLSYGGLDEFRDDSGNVISGDSGVYDACVSVVLGRQISSKLSLGITLKDIIQKYGPYSSNGFGIDIGMLYTGNDKLSAGMSIQNIAPQMKIDNTANSVPLNIKIGGSYKPIPKLLLALDIDKPNDIDYQLHIGAELNLEDKVNLGRIISLRIGYNQIGESLAFDRGLTLGVGMRTTSKKEEFFEATDSEGTEMQMDYAAVLVGEGLGYGHRISLGIRFK